jgi:hypothetical protein
MMLIIGGQGSLQNLELKVSKEIFPTQKEIFSVVKTTVMTSSETRSVQHLKPIKEADIHSENEVSSEHAKSKR